MIGEYAINSAAGAAYIYVRGTSGWPAKPAAALADPAASSDDYFGYSVAVSGNVAVVGAYGTNAGAGAAYIFVKGTSGWPTTPTATLADPAPPSTSNDAFGFSVTVSGSTVVVGAWGTNSGAGAAYIYVKGSSGWPTTPTTTLADPVAGQSAFGFSVAVSGNTAVVGDPGNPEAAYVYVKGSSGWGTTPRATLVDPAASLFGFSVAISGSTAVVGAHDTSGGGAAYIFVRGSSGWPTTPTAALADPAATPGDAFGISVAVSGSTAVVGAYGTNATAGAAYIYVKGTSGWPSTPTATLADPSTGADGFGYSVTTSGNTAVVGAYGTNSGAGAAYLYSA